MTRRPENALRNAPAPSLEVAAVDLAIDKRPLDKLAAEALRQRIVSGGLAPGARLVESQLSEQMSLSRGTIRSALNDLTHEGLVTQTAYTKWVVTEFSAEDVWELFTLRSALEGLAARLAAERIGAEQEVRLWKAFDDLESASGFGDWARLTDADFQLHKTIVEIARHGRLAQQYRLLEQQVRMVIGSSNALVPTTSEVVAQHRPLVEAIAAGRRGTRGKAGTCAQPRGRAAAGRARRRHAAPPARRRARRRANAARGATRARRPRRVPATELPA